MGKPKHSSSRSSKKDDRATKQLIRKQKAKRQASNDYETEKTFNRLINNMGFLFVLCKVMAIVCFAQLVIN